MKYEDLTLRQQKVYAIADVFHEGQRRIYTGEDYINHPIEVASILFTHGLRKEGHIEVALCHDLLLDTACDAKGLNGLLLQAGYRKEEADGIVTCVSWLTDRFTKDAYPLYNRKIRKGLEALKFQVTPAIIQNVKLADLISNTNSITEHDPGLAEIYLKEKAQILHYLTDCDKELYTTALDAIPDEYRYIVKYGKA